MESPQILVTVSSLPFAQLCSIAAHTDAIVAVDDVDDLVLTWQRCCY